MVKVRCEELGDAKWSVGRIVLTMRNAADVDDAEGDDMATTSPEALSQGKTACEKAGPWQFLE